MYIEDIDLLNLILKENHHLEFFYSSCGDLLIKVISNNTYTFLTIDSVDLRSLVFLFNKIDFSSGDLPF